MSASVGQLFVEFGANIGDLVTQFNQVAREVEGVTGRIVRAGDALKSVGTDLSMKVTAPIAAVGVASAKAAIDFESAFAGVRKTVDATEGEFKTIEAGIRNMAKTIPATATEIAGVAEAAGQLGIKKEALMGFTRTMVDLGNATNLSAGDAATQLARLANITQMPQNEFDRLGSTVVALGNNLATTEGEIVAMGLRLAGAGSQAGMSEAQILSFAGALSSVGIMAEAGGSAFSTVFKNIQNSVQTGNAELQGFAAVAGMSAAQFKQAFQQDAAGAVVAFTEGLGRINQAGGNTIGVLDKLGMSDLQVSDALLRAAGSGDLFRRSLEIGSDAWKTNTALTNEANQRYQTTASVMAIAKNQVADAAIIVGRDLIPAIRTMSTGVATAATMFGNLNPNIRQGAVALAMVAAAAGPVLIAAGALTAAAGALAGSWLGVAAASTYSAVVTTAQQIPAMVLAARQAVLTGAAIAGTYVASLVAAAAQAAITANLMIAVLVPAVAKTGAAFLASAVTGMAAATKGLVVWAAQAVAAAAVAAGTLIPVLVAATRQFVVLAATGIATAATALGAFAVAAATAVASAVVAFAPLLLTVGAVAAAGAGLYMAWQHNLFGIQDIVNKAVSFVVDRFKDLYDMLPQGVRDSIGWVGSAFNSLPGKISGGVAGAAKTIKDFVFVSDINFEQLAKSAKANGAQTAKEIEAALKKIGTGAGVAGVDLGNLGKTAGKTATAVTEVTTAAAEMDGSVRHLPGLFTDLAKAMSMVKMKPLLESQDVGAVFREMSAEMKDVTERAQLLGDTTNVAGNKAKVAEKAFDKLRAMLGSSAPEVQELAAMVVSLNATQDANAMAASQAATAAADWQVTLDGLSAVANGLAPTLAETTTQTYNFGNSATEVNSAINGMKDGVSTLAGLLGIDLNAGVMSAVGQFTSFAGASVQVVTAAGSMSTAISGLGPAIAGVVATVGAAGVAVLGLATGLGALTIGWLATSKSVQEFGDRVKWVTALGGPMMVGLQGIGDAIKWVDANAAKIQETFTGMVTIGRRAFHEVGQAANKSLNVVIRAVNNVIDGINKMSWVTGISLTPFKELTEITWDQVVAAEAQVKVAEQQVAAWQQQTAAVVELEKSLNQSLASGFQGALSGAIKGFLDGTKSLTSGLRDGVRDAIIAGIAEAATQGAIMKGAFGKQLEQLSSVMATGNWGGAQNIIKDLAAQVPALASNLASTLKPLRDTLQTAFSGQSSKVAEAIDAQAEALKQLTFDRNVLGKVSDEATAKIDIFRKTLSDLQSVGATGDAFFAQTKTQLDALLSAQQQAKGVETYGKWAEQQRKAGAPSEAWTMEAFQKAGIPALAAGGVTTRPTTALIGEAGPEAVVPLKPAVMADLGANIGPYVPESKGKGPVTIVLNYHGSGDRQDMQAFFEEFYAFGQLKGVFA